ncbi:hypothetical protein AB0K18_27515 [Nonomuraea sp. NPDC049421]|uniref:Uncharacterized protein n=1 Tax=Nonomuraea salmonea TaxID=46181 RepID=A0ABV5NSA5_9ACTN
MGRHAKPHNPKEQPQETQEDAQNEHPPSRGRHAKHTKDRHRCTATTGEQAAVSS